MWLLDTTTLQLRHFISNIPQYVILSHTWGEGEVSFVDIDQPYAKEMAGYSKISRCCVQALEAGFEWAWVDTCCIDKRSSAELSEAINSMYKWYWDAAICYVLISDRSIRYAAIESSRWFERGWTLQELLAPDVVEFYDSDWKFIGTRTGLIDQIFAATKIDKRYLLDRTAIKDASIATKFSWASARRTTREEDKAYCLLGLVQVNMPMLYGEGSGAFYRLQLEIIKQTNDHTIFAWEYSSHRMSYMSIFAPSPAQFENAAGFLPNATRERQPATYEMTNHGLNITIPCIIRRNGVLALLDCSNSTGTRFGIELEATGVSTYRRLDRPLVEVAHKEVKQATPKNIYLGTRSRQLVEEAVTRNGTMRVYNTSDPGKIRRIATGTFCELFRYQQHVFFELQNPEPQPNDLISTLEDHIVYDGDFMSFVFMVDGITDYLFFLGLYRDRPWIHASPCCPARWVEKVEEKRKVYQAGTVGPPNSSNQTYFTDHVRFPIEGGRVLEAVARKTRSKEGLRWRLNISLLGKRIEFIRGLHTLRTKAECVLE